MCSLLPSTQATSNSPKSRLILQQTQKILKGTSALELVLSKLAQLGSLLKAVFNPKTSMAWQTTGAALALVLEQPSQTLITAAKVLKAAIKLFKDAPAPTNSITLVATQTGGFRVSNANTQTWCNIL